MTALDGYLIYQPVADTSGPIEYQITNRLRVSATRNLPLRECLTLKLPLWSTAEAAHERAAPTRFRELLGRVGDAPVTSLAETRWAELLQAGGSRQLAITDRR